MAGVLEAGRKGFFTGGIKDWAAEAGDEGEGEADEERNTCVTWRKTIVG